MLRVLAVVVMSGVPCLASSPQEADFPAGYWDWEAPAYGQQMMTYSLSIVASDPAKARAEAESIMRRVGATLTAFSDQTASKYPAGYGGRQARQAYSLAFQLSDEKAAAAAKHLMGLGRLTTYNANSPYAMVQIGEIKERLESIEKERESSTESLKSMPVSRALLDSKYKRLKAALESSEQGNRKAAVSLQILREPSPDENLGVPPPLMIDR